LLTFVKREYKFHMIRSLEILTWDDSFHSNHFWCCKQVSLNWMGTQTILDVEALDILSQTTRLSIWCYTLFTWYYPHNHKIDYATNDTLQTNIQTGYISFAMIKNELVIFTIQSYSRRFLNSQVLWGGTVCECVNLSFVTSNSFYISDLTTANGSQSSTRVPPAPSGASLVRGDIMRTTQP